LVDINFEKPPNSIVYGDFTCNGVVDATDILWMQRYIASERDIPRMLRTYSTTLTEFNESAADFTNNGLIDATDILWMQRYIASERNIERMLKTYGTTIDFSHIH
jgi:uncharacterized alpha-E superfamily protein